MTRSGPVTFKPATLIDNYLHSTNDRGTKRYEEFMRDFSQLKTPQEIFDRMLCIQSMQKENGVQSMLVRKDESFEGSRLLDMPVLNFITLSNATMDGLHFGFEVTNTKDLLDAVIGINRDYFMRESNIYYEKDYFNQGKNENLLTFRTFDNHDLRKAYETIEIIVKAAEKNKEIYDRWVEARNLRSIGDEPQKSFSIAIRGFLKTKNADYVIDDCLYGRSPIHIYPKIMFVKTSKELKQALDAHNLYLAECLSVYEGYMSRAHSELIEDFSAYSKKMEAITPKYQAQY